MENDLCDYKQIELQIEKEQKQLKRQLEMNDKVLMQIIKPMITELNGLTSEQEKEKEACKND